MEMNNGNPAARILKIMKRMRSVSVNKDMRMLHVFRKGIDGEVDMSEIDHKSHAQLKETSRQRQLVVNEVDRLREIFKLSGRPRELYDRHCTELEKLFGYARLQSKWKQKKDHYLKGGLIDTLEQWAFDLDDEPRGDLSEQERQEIEDLVSKLTETAEGSDIPRVAQQFILSQIDKIERAVRDYPIKGRAVFVATATEIANDFARNENKLTGEEDNSTVSETIGYCFGKLMEIGSHTDTVLSLIERASELPKLLPPP